MKKRKAYLLCAQELPAVGDEMCGLIVTGIVRNAQYNQDFVHMEHEKTGSGLVYIPCEDTQEADSAA